jgi:hypothetical protein
MMRTRGPRGVDTRIMEVLLDIVNDLADILRRNVGISSTPRGGFDDPRITSGTDGGLDVPAKQRNNAGLVLGGWSRCISLHVRPIFLNRKSPTRSTLIPRN